jgi:hypothetical protein
VSCRRSTSTVEKQAGALGRGVRLDVVNEGPAGIGVSICGDGQCRSTQDLDAGGTTNMARRGRDFLASRGDDLEDYKLMTLTVRQ